MPSTEYENHPLISYVTQGLKGPVDSFWLILSIVAHDSTKDVLNERKRYTLIPRLPKTFETEKNLNPNVKLWSVVPLQMFCKRTFLTSRHDVRD